jgi:hypothetical protein
MALPHAKTFERLLAAALSPQTAAEILSAAEKRCRAMLTARPVLETGPHMRKQVLPTLALYQALILDAHLEKVQALDLLQPVFLETYFGLPRRGLLAFNRLLTRLPLQPFPLLRPLIRAMCLAEKETRPEILVDNDHSLIVHSRRCPILEKLTELGAPELTLLFCASDDWLAASIPGMHWRRTTTLARGGDRCDFDWERV